MAVQSQTYPIIKLIESPDAYNPLPKVEERAGAQFFSPIKGAQESKVENDIASADREKVIELMKKLGKWLFNKKDNLASGNLKLETKQKMMRELGMIDILVQLLYQYYNVEKDGEVAGGKTVIQGIVKLLQ
jgi:hypothetical protein